jgi:hypothetical protein
MQFKINQFCAVVVNIIEDLCRVYVNKLTLNEGGRNVVILQQRPKYQKFWCCLHGALLQLSWVWTIYYISHRSAGCVAPSPRCNN